MECNAFFEHVYMERAQYQMTLLLLLLLLLILLLLSLLLLLLYYYYCKWFSTCYCLSIDESLCGATRGFPCINTQSSLNAGSAQGLRMSLLHFYCTHVAHERVITIPVTHFS